MKYSALVLLALTACGRQDLDSGSGQDEQGTADGHVGAKTDAAIDSTAELDLSGPSEDAASRDDVGLSPGDGEERADGAVLDAGVDRSGGEADAGLVPYRALLVAAGSSHSCALLDDHNLKCWGDNSYGALGTGDPKNRGVVDGDMGNNLPVVNLGTGRTARTVSAGRYATCAILDDDTVKCWGLASQAFGREYVMTSASSFAIGDDASEMGDALPRIDLGPGHTAKRLAVGYSDICVGREDQSLRCWGSDTSVRDFPASAGRGIAALTGADGVIALFDDGTVSAILGTPPPSRTNARAVAVGGSRAASCVLWADGRITGTNAWRPVDAMDLAIPVLTEEAWPCGVFKDGSVTCPLENGTPPWLGGDAGHGPTVRLGQPVISMTAGFLHFCAALTNGEVKCWTTEDHPVLGLGNSYPTETDWPSVDLGTHLAP